MLYLDTSFITPLLLNESTSADVKAYVGRLPAGIPSHARGRY